MENFFIVYKCFQTFCLYCVQLFNLVSIKKFAHDLKSKYEYDSPEVSNAESTTCGVAGEIVRKYEESVDECQGESAVSDDEVESVRREYKRE